MKPLLMKEAGEIGGGPEVRVGPDAGDDEEQRRRTALAIEGDAQVAAAFQGRQPVSPWEDRHADYLPLEAGHVAVGVQDGGRDRREVGVAIRILVFLGARGAP